MKLNELLFSLSARHSGSWQQFKGVVEELRSDTDAGTAEDQPESTNSGAVGLSRYLRLRLSLERLAHVEFFAQGCENGWRVAPPTMALSNDNGPWQGILCGARSLALLDRLERPARGAADIFSEAQPGGPNVIRIVAAEPEVHAAIACQSGVLVQRQAPLAILSVLPPIDTELLSEGDLPIGEGWEIHRFSPRNLTWRPLTGDVRSTSPNGLYRFRGGFQLRHFLIVKGRTYEVKGQFGKYLLLRRRKVLRYLREMRALVVPGICRPPTLVDRCLVLCSGRLPVWDRTSSTLTYPSVSPGAAALAARVLCQELML